MHKNHRFPGIRWNHDFPGFHIIFEVHESYGSCGNDGLHGTPWVRSTVPWLLSGQARLRKCLTFGSLCRNCGALWYHFWLFFDCHEHLGNGRGPFLMSSSWLGHQRCPRRRLPQNNVTFRNPFLRFLIFPAMFSSIVFVELQGPCFMDFGCILITFSKCFYTCLYLCIYWILQPFQSKSRFSTFFVDVLACVVFSKIVLDFSCHWVPHLQSLFRKMFRTWLQKKGPLTCKRNPIDMSGGSQRGRFACAVRAQNADRIRFYFFSNCLEMLFESASIANVSRNVRRNEKINVKSTLLVILRPWPRLGELWIPCILQSAQKSNIFVSVMSHPQLCIEFVSTLDFLKNNWASMNTHPHRMKKRGFPRTLGYPWCSWIFFFQRCPRQTHTLMYMSAVCSKSHAWLALDSC